MKDGAPVQGAREGERVYMDEKIRELFQSLSLEKQEIAIAMMEKMIAASEQDGKASKNTKENIA